MTAAAHPKSGLARPPGAARAALVHALLAVALLAACTASVLVGPSSVGAAELWAWLTGGELSGAARAIITSVRLPRTLAGVLAGAAFAVAGVLIQAALDNPLAGPNIIGANSGAGLAVLVASALALVGVSLPVPLALVAFVGALAASALIFAVSARTGASRLTVVLVGVAVNAVLGAGMDVVLIVAPNAYIESSTFLVGGLSGIALSDLPVPAVLVAVGLVGAALLAPRLNVLVLGDDIAHSLGMRVRAVRLAALACASLLVGAAVSFAGLIGFVGLMVPHAMRALLGHDNRLLVPASALAGAAFTVACDLVARTAFAPYELPVGIIMSLVGGPFFVWMALRGKAYRDE